MLPPPFADVTGALATPELLLLPALAFAAGLDLYLTLLVVAALGLMAPGSLPPGPLHDLALPSVVAVAGALYLLEAAAEQRPLSGLLWHTAQVVARPLAAGLLAVLLLDGRGGLVMALGAAGAAVVAFLVHSVKIGAGLLLELVLARPPFRSLRTLGEDVVVGGLLILTLEVPSWATILALTALLVILLGGPTLRRAHRFGLRLLRGRIVHLITPADWRGADELPAWCRAAATATGSGSRPEGSTTLRGARAGAWGVRGAGGFRSGWLLVPGGRPSFAYRERPGASGIALPLPPDATRRISRHPLCTRAELGGNSDRVIFLLPKDGPGAEALERELTEGPGTS